MSKFVVTLAGLAVAVSAPIAAAKTSSDSEYRGYQTCIEAAEQETQGLVPSRHYYINENGSEAEYFINATAWADGDRAAVRIACETAAKGRQLVNAYVENGIFKNSREGSVRVEVAQN